jgi:phage gpG-like protein
VGFSGATIKLGELAGFVRSVHDARAPMSEAMAATAFTKVQQGFRESVDPSGNPWRELAEDTVKSRRKGKKKRGPKILIDTGRLRNSISAKSDDQGFKIGTNVEYGVYHQQPDGPGKGIIPRRQFLPEGAEYAEPLRKTAVRFMRKWKAGARRAV